MEASGDKAKLIAAIELAIGGLDEGPTLGQFGIVREDCALAHIDYFASVNMSASILIRALADATGEETSSIHQRLRPTRRCDCRACAGPEESKRARQEAVRITFAELRPRLLGRLSEIADSQGVEQAMRILEEELGGAGD